MKPLVKDTTISLDQLLAELDDPRSFAAPGNLPNTTHAHDVLDVISQKVMRVLRKASKKAEQAGTLQDKLQELEQLWGVEPGNAAYLWYVQLDAGPAPLAG